MHEFKDKCNFDIVSTTSPFRPHVCPSAANNSTPTGRIVMKFDIWVPYKNVGKIPVSWKSDKNNG